MWPLLQDLRYGIRLLIKHKSFAFVVVITLAFGIGINTSVFSIINTLLLSPLPVKDPERLVIVATRLPNLDSFHGLYYQDYLYYRDNKDAFSDLIAFMPAPVNLSAGTEPERIWTEVVSGNFFSSLGVGTELGRAFLPEEGETPATHPVVVLSHAYWQKRFAGDRSVIGKVLKLNGYPFTVIGVTSENFRGTVPLVSIDAYIPAMMLPQLMPGGAEALESRAEDGFRVMGHLKPGVSVDYANKVIAVLARQLEQQYPLTNKGRTTLVVPETQARPDPEIGSYLPPVSLIFMTLVGM